MYIESTDRVPQRPFCASFGLLIALLLATAGMAWADADPDAPSSIRNTYSPSTPSPAESVVTGRWLGPDQKPLPFSEEWQLVDFLNRADISKLKQLSSGSTRPWKVMLEHNGVQAHAIFRTVDHSSGEGHRSFEDKYSFEVAAYQTARLLGLDNVPPAVIRVVDGKEGSLQLWVEGARSETERIALDEVPKSPSKVLLQKHMMRVFDHLIYNFDRNTGNMLLDGDQKLWLVDHTRTFKALPVLPDSSLRLCERDLWESLSSLEAHDLKQALSPYLSPIQVAAVVKRHQKLVKHLGGLIEEQGEHNVLFDI